MTIPEADAVSTLLRYLAPGSTVPAEDAADAAAYLTGKVHSALLAGPAQVREWVTAHAEVERLRAEIAAQVRVIAQDGPYGFRNLRAFIARHDRLSTGNSVVAVLLALADEIETPGRATYPKDGTCGDCATGKCHGTDPDDCGCARHDASTQEADCG